MRRNDGNFDGARAARALWGGHIGPTLRRRNLSFLGCLRKYSPLRVGLLLLGKTDAEAKSLAKADAVGGMFLK